MFFMNFFCEILWVVFHSPWYGQSCIFYINLKMQEPLLFWVLCRRQSKMLASGIFEVFSPCWLTARCQLQTGWLTSYTKLRLVYLSYRLLSFLPQVFGTLMLFDAHSGLSCVPEELPPFSWFSLCFQYCSLLWYLFCLVIIYLPTRNWLVCAFDILFRAFSFILSLYL